MMKSVLCISLILGLLLIGCRPEIIEPRNDKPSAADKVIVLCEGNFTWGNASFDLYEPSTDKVFDDIFKTENGMALGDVLQSGVVVDGRLMLVLNNSSKIIITDTGKFKFNYQITGLQSPRYILPGKNGHQG